MGTDNLFHKNKARKAESHRREKAKRAPYERVLIVCEGEKMKWYSYGGHLEKSVIETKLLEVRYDNKEEELFEAI